MIYHEVLYLHVSIWYNLQFEETVNFPSALLCFLFIAVANIIPADTDCCWGSSAPFKMLNMCYSFNHILHTGSSEVKRSWLFYWFKSKLNNTRYLCSAVLDVI